MAISIFQLYEMLDKWESKRISFKNWAENTSESSTRKVYGAKQFQLEECIDDIRKLIKQIEL